MIRVFETSQPSHSHHQNEKPEKIDFPNMNDFMRIGKKNAEEKKGMKLRAIKARKLRLKVNEIFIP